MPAAAMKQSTTQKASGVQQILDVFLLASSEPSAGSTVSAEDFRARLSQLQEEDLDLKILAELFSLKSPDLRRASDRLFCSLRTLKVCSVTGGGAFKTIHTTLGELGYDAEWQVLNSKDFGVPQNRERVYIVGYLRGKCSGQVFPLGEIPCKTEAVPMKNIGTRLIQVGIIDRTYESSGRVFSSNGLSPTLVIPGGGGRTVKILNGGRVRCLTPREYWRLQGFPDWAFERAEKVNSDTQLYKQAGNSVTVPVIAAIADKLSSIIISN